VSPNSKLRSNLRDRHAAHRLAAYQTARGLTDADLARDLGCAPEALTMIRLCRAPRWSDDGADAGEDVRYVAERFGCAPGSLAEALGVPMSNAPRTVSGGSDRRALCTSACARRTM
jgi:hypothetical protein